MPRKQKTTRQEKASESFFEQPINAKKTTEKTVARETPREEILRGATEKKTSIMTLANEKLVETVIKTSSKPLSSELITIEKKGFKKKKTTRKKTSKRKTTRKKSSKKTITKKIIYKIPKILLQKDGYELLITEKPQAGMKIAAALGVAKKRELVKGVSYYEVDRHGHKIIVASAVGHLFTLKQITPGSRIPEFNINWVPNYMARKGDFSKKYYDTFLKLAKNAGSITIATDFDVEGEVIGTNIVRLICNQEDANRMKFSTLTKDELNKAYDEKLPSIDWNQEIAGESRHYLDWYYGINLSRALMKAIKTTGKFKIMSIGRVQGPTLALIVKREKEIKAFEPETYWQIFATIESPKIEVKYVKNIFNKKELEDFKGLIGQTGEAKTKKTEQIVPPNIPFNLTGLQTECYSLYGITPANSLRAAQSLYLAGLISYPRTSSQKLPIAIDYKKILDILKIRYLVAKLITKTKPIEGKKEDSAHPSIYPTGNKPPILSGDEEKVYNIIVKRFLALFCDSAIIDRKRIAIKTKDNKTFSANGNQIRIKNWMEFYPTKTKEIELPDIEGEVIFIDKKIEEKQTQPPKRYSPASILTELEKRNLGTKATRAAILDTLYDRGYIREKSIEATALGVSLIDTLEKYSPIIIDEALTKNLQDGIDKIIEKIKKKKEMIEKKEEILTKAKNTIIKISKEFETKGKLIGKELMDAEIKQREIQKKENILCKCPRCNSGDLAITYSPKTRRFFVACNAYPNCKNTYPLPPRGTIKKTGKICEHCGFPLLMALSKGKKPWIFCFNTECESNKERIEEYKKRQAEKKLQD